MKKGDFKYGFYAFASWFRMIQSQQLSTGFKFIVQKWENFLRKSKKLHFFITMGKIVFNEDEEIVVPEPTVQKNVEVEDPISDDDEAPEAISTSTAKESLLTRVNAEKEAAAK